jgi:hypothetical protein
MTLQVYHQNLSRLSRGCVGALAGACSTCSNIVVSTKIRYLDAVARELSAVLRGMTIHNGEELLPAWLPNDDQGIVHKPVFYTAQRRVRPSARRALLREHTTAIMIMRKLAVERWTSQIQSYLGKRGTFAVLP